MGASIDGPLILIRGKPSQIGFDVISTRRGTEGNLKNRLDLLFEVNDLLLGGRLANKIQPARIDVLRCLVLWRFLSPETWNLSTKLNGGRIVEHDKVRKSRMSGWHFPIPFSIFGPALLGGFDG